MSFSEVPWPRVRELVVDFLVAGDSVRMAHGMTEIDISRPYALIEDYKTKVPEGVSLTAYLTYCLARAIDHHKMLHAYRKGRNKLVIFDDVDVNTVLEKQKPNGVMVPVAYIVRGANHKTFAQINHELRSASKSDLADDSGVKLRARLMRLPTPVRRLLWWRLLHDPVMLKKQWGTVSLSNVGSFITPRPGWGISITFQTCTMIVGGMYDRVVWNNGQVEPRKTMSITFSVNHDIVDGGPGVRFAETFVQIIETAQGLGEDFLDEALKLCGTAS